jgi:ABC-type dipeptide/oligopeptide/nickel transport system ATPase subunit
MVWQDPYSALSPYQTIRRSLREPLDAFAVGDVSGRDKTVKRLIELVGLDSKLLDRRPHQLSGGECQRVVIARALAPEPRILILDEPLSALDPNSQAEVVPILQAASGDTRRAVLLISHDLTAVRSLASHVAMLHEGRVVEIQDTSSFFAAPIHNASREFLRAWPSLPFRSLQQES